jgi:hypothetical protein
MLQVSCRRVIYCHVSCGACCVVPRVLGDCSQPTSSVLPFLSVAFSTGYFAYDTWDMIQVWVIIGVGSEAACVAAGDCIACVTRVTLCDPSPLCYNCTYVCNVLYAHTLVRLHLCVYMRCVVDSVIVHVHTLAFIRMVAHLRMYYVCRTAWPVRRHTSWFITSDFCSRSPWACTWTPLSSSLVSACCASTTPCSFTWYDHSPRTQHIVRTTRTCLLHASNTSVNASLHCTSGLYALEYMVHVVVDVRSFFASSSVQRVLLEMSGHTRQNSPVFR